MPPTPALPVIGLKADIRQVCTSIKPAHDCGYQEEVYANTLEGVTITKEYPDIVTTLAVGAGDTVYVVWAEWSAGDSFGIDIKRYYETFGVFRDMASARQLDQALQQRKLKTVDTDDGQHFRLPVPRPWGGFYDRFENIHIHETTIRRPVARQ